MDSELLVANRIDDGRKLIAKLVGDGVDVAVACWLKTSEEGLWFLYVGSKAAEAPGLGDAYRRLYSCLSQVPNIGISLSDVKLVPPSDPIAQDAISVRDRLAARIPTRYQAHRLGNLSIDEAYIYPRSMASMTQDEVLQTVVALMNRTGVLQPSIVTLSNGTKINAIPTAVTGQSRGSVRVLFRNVDSNSDTLVSPDEVQNIQ